MFAPIATIVIKDLFLAGGACHIVHRLCINVISLVERTITTDLEPGSLIVVLEFLVVFALLGHLGKVEDTVLSLSSTFTSFLPQ
jgi:hypothetical protein